MSFGDEEAIEGVVAAYVEAFRGRDFDAWGALFTEDADFVGNEGEWARSRRENVELHEGIPDSVARQLGGYDLRVAGISFIKTDVALVHALWEWPNFVEESGEEAVDREGIITMVMSKQESGWRIRASHNTRTR